MRIFGREPALVIGAVGSLMTVLAALNVPGLSAGAAAAITALIAAGITAWATRPVAPALYVGVIGAGASLLAEYGFHVSDGTVAAIGGAIVAGFALFGVRPQVSPAGEPARPGSLSSVGRGGNAAVIAALAIVALGVATLPAYAATGPARPGERAARPVATAPSPSTLRCTTVTEVPAQIRLDRCTSGGALVGYRPFMWDAAGGVWVQLATA
ncbi:hypothetical protein TPA0907_55990 [Micromonospora humidisoli]|uniref:hypothetical protein n=1 Tax=Micromonospora sp. AKA109 TaxID=2733865 RepID=UPI0022BF9054|nr:hypothetical protein [Micromonospora sp. AKA109]GHJ11232.1 hypothetical protein TPA0907_55990 [Micromonospora sp. AKA109]